MNRYPCPSAAGDDTVHRYVAGTLEPAGVDAFEAHLLACGPCRDAVRAGAALRSAFRRRDARRRSVALVSVGSLAAAAMVAWLLLPSTDPIARLGRVGSAPRFEGLPVRAEPDSLTVLEDRAMAAYAARDYRRAAVLLDSASAAHHGPAVPFFLGIARLKTGFARDALEALGRALEPPRNPYVAEARLYRAKAWLALLQADSALAELARVPADAGATLVHAQALADSVREALRR